MDFGFYVYVQETQNGRLYIGYTGNLVRRRVAYLIQNSYTSRRLGWSRLVYCEYFDNKSSAILREKELKTGKGRLFLKEKLGKVRWQ